MQLKFFIRAVFVGFLVLGTGVRAPGETMERPPASAEDLAFFETKIRPALSTHCFGCHGAEKQSGGLRLDHIEFVLSGGDSGPALQLANPAESLIGVAISYESVDLQMPPKGRLPEETRKDLADWIGRGAPWPEEPLPENRNTEEAFDLEKLRDEHWAWHPVREAAPPEVKDERFAAYPVDRFLQAAREVKGLETAPEADRRALIRRAHFTITGLPPTREAVEAFVHDQRSDAYERLIDGLLADPAYGERWSRHWFDLVRYADTHGHEGDYPIRHAWTYRDYVIRSLNADLPYDQFVREHIAGDLLDRPRRHPESGYNESILATGFWFMHQATHAPVDVQKDYADRVDNQIDVMSKAFLGMTVSCARCHDHKFDAISARDYHAMAGHLYSARQAVAYLDPGQRIQSALLSHRAVLREQIHDTITQIESVPDLEAQPIAPYLEGAAKVLFDHPKPSDGVPPPTGEVADPDAPKPVGRPVEKVAEELGLDTDQLARWRTALAEPGVSSPSHPLYVWSQLSQEARQVNTRKFMGRASELSALVTEPGTPDWGPEYWTYASFDKGTFEDWFVAGEAFGSAPSEDASWHAIGGELAPVPAGVAHSGLGSDRLEGTLRSPTFTIDCDYIHFRVAGRNGRMRLVIDGYQLTPDNGLLFGNTMVDSGDTLGAFVWRSMGNQVGKYRGRRAYIELIDESDGYIAVDQVVFSTRPEPPADPVTPLENAISPDITIKSMLISDLALRYEAAFRNAWKANASDYRQLAADPKTALLLRRGLWWPAETRPARDVIRTAVNESNQRIEPPMKALVATAGTPENAEYFIRGDHRNPDGTVPRAFLTALAPAQLDAAPDRIALANKMVDPANPLTARVYVNRIWHHLFGRGIVPSVDNFGKLGQFPSHPELLDYLATRFVAEGWSTKKLIRELMLTETYRMSSVPQFPDAEAQDPTNIWLHRMPVQRLEGEAIRDTLLALGGNLNATMYGPPVPAYISPFERNRRSPSNSGPLDGNRRRTVYLEVRRNHMLPMVTAFDMPVPDTTVGSRTVSNLPAQALIMMNDEFVVDQARVWSERLLNNDLASFDDLVTALYEEALSRSPREREREALAGFVSAQAALYGLPEEGAWRDSRVLADLCHTVFMLKEFIYVG